MSIAHMTPARHASEPATPTQRAHHNADTSETCRRARVADAADADTVAGMHDDEDDDDNDDVEVEGNSRHETDLDSDANLRARQRHPDANAAAPHRDADATCGDSYVKATLGPRDGENVIHGGDDTRRHWTDDDDGHDTDQLATNQRLDDPPIADAYNDLSYCQQTVYMPVGLAPLMIRFASTFFSPQSLDTRPHYNER